MIKIKYSENSKPLIEHGEVVVSTKGIVGIICGHNVPNKDRPREGDTVKVLEVAYGKMKLSNWSALHVKRFSGSIEITQ